MNCLLAIGPVATAVPSGRLRALYIFQLKMTRRHEPTPNNPLHPCTSVRQEQLFDRCQSGDRRRQIAFVSYLPTPICFISVALSQNRYSSAMTPCLFQCPSVAIGRW